MFVQRILSFFRFYFTEKIGILKFVFANLKDLIFPLITVYFVLTYIQQYRTINANYYSYLYVGIFYVIFTLSFPQKIMLWIDREKQRGTFETIFMTQLGIVGITRYLFIVYVISFFLIEIPLFIFLAEHFFSFNLLSYINLNLAIFILLNLMLSYGLSLIGVSITLLSKSLGFFLSGQRVTWNLLAGVYCPQALFPFILLSLSYILPFTYGLILCRKIIFETMSLIPLDFLPFTIIATSFALAGKLFLRKTLITLQQKGSFSFY